MAVREVGDPELLLPPAAILLHIGPFKTGSTALQSALFARQQELADYGVAYPGRWRRLFRQGHALMRWSPRGRPLPPVSVWDDFAASVREMGDVRVCLSTEDFGRIRDSKKTRKVIEDLGADRLHVVAVARAYHRLMPSHWQERMKSFDTTSYENFLHKILEDDADPGSSSFWASHDMGEMLSKWLEVLPPDRFTVIVSDDQDRYLLLRVFESMLGLPTGLLELDENANSSLSYSALEVLRELNGHFARRGWSDKTYVEVIQQGMVPELARLGRVPGDLAIPPLPDWALPLVAERTRRRVASIEASGVNVVGDLADLALPVDYRAATAEELKAVDSVSTRAAAAALAGVVGAASQAGLGRTSSQNAAAADGVGADAGSALRIDQAPAMELVRETARRVEGRARRLRRRSS